MLEATNEQKAAILNWIGDNRAKIEAVLEKHGKIVRHLTNGEIFYCGEQWLIKTRGQPWCGDLHVRVTCSDERFQLWAFKKNPLVEDTDGFIVRSFADWCTLEKLDGTLAGFLGLFYR